MERKNDWKKWRNWFLYAVAIIVVYKLLDNFSNVATFLKNLWGVLAPFAVGILIAYILYFPCRSIEKAYEKTKLNFVKKKARFLAVITTYLIALLVIIIIVNVIIPTLSTSVIDLASNLPSYYKNITEFVENQPEDSILKQIGAREIIVNLEKIDLKEYFKFENIINYVKSAIGIVNGVFSGFVAIMASIYVLLERREILTVIRKFGRANFSDKVCDNFEKYFSKTNDIFYRFISSQIIDAGVVAVILSIAMVLMGVKYAVLLGVMIGVFNIIPYFGAIIGVIIALLITLLTGGVSQAIWTGIVIIILQQIDANIINPKIVGNSLTLSPLLVIFAVTVGGAYFGFFGMFLAVPAVTVIKILVGDYLNYKSSKNKALEE